MSSARTRPQPEAGAAEAAESDEAVRVLVDVNHPAQVHLFRNPIAELQARGHETLVTSRDKEVTLGLLDAYDLEHRPLTARGDSVPSLAWELLKREVRLLSVAREFGPDVVVSRVNPAAAHVSGALGARYVAISDTRIDATALRRLYQAVTFPFVDTVCAPESFELPVDDDSRRPLDFQELSYLHPRYFEPDPAALVEHGIDPDEPYYVVRLAGWDAFHDVGHDGLSPDAVRELVSFLADRGTVYVSAEGPVPADLAAGELPTPPELVHQVLYFADLYVGDSGTMSTEAAMLGTPAIRTNSMVGEDDEDVFHALEERYGLLRSFRSERRALETAERLVADGIDRRACRRRRERLVEDQPDACERIVEAVLEAAGTAGDHGNPTQ